MPDLRELSDNELVARLRAANALAADADDRRLHAMLPLVRERLVRPDDFDGVFGFLLVDEVEPPHDELIPAEATDTNTAAVLRLAREIIAHSDELARETLEPRLRDLAVESDWEPRALFASLGYAIAGRPVALPLVESMCLLGKAACIERIDAAIDVLGSPENPILGTSGSEA